MQSVQIGGSTFTIKGQPGDFSYGISCAEVQAGVYEVTIRLSAEKPCSPPAFKCSWSYPDVDVAGTWHTGADRARGIAPNWSSPWRSRAASQAPVVTLFSKTGKNRLTFACSEALNAVDMHAGVIEESAEFACYVSFFVEPVPPITHYTATIRIDMRDIHYSRALADVSSWWASLPGFEPSRTPAPAREPMYSTWYSFHQNITVEGVLRQCRLAKELGCKAVIVDDGWQTLDSQRGYAFAGDWQPERIGDMRGFVDAVHQLDMKFLLWFSVPHMGLKSKGWEKFKHKMLFTTDRLSVGYMDPRFPDVREYLITTFERRLQDWDLDGLKLDFVDGFAANNAPAAAPGDGRDFTNVSEAADRLLTDIMLRLRAIKPDVMIEFRQSYIGPLMRKYGNMFRAGDCPNDALTNRLRTLDVRLISGDTVTHADPQMWHPDEPVEVAAQQIINTLFAVPQLSVLLDRLPAKHHDMVRFYMQFWREHRNLLLDAELEPASPELLYPYVMARGNHSALLALYDTPLARPGLLQSDELLIVNGTTESRLILDLPEAYGPCHILVHDCTGRVCRDEKQSLPAGISTQQVPPSGIIKITKMK